LRGHVVTDQRQNSGSGSRRMSCKEKRESARQRVANHLPDFLENPHRRRYMSMQWLHWDDHVVFLNEVEPSGKRGTGRSSFRNHSCQDL
jgi:hypothetical protein